MANTKAEKEQKAAEREALKAELRKEIEAENAAGANAPFEWPKDKTFKFKNDVQSVTHSVLGDITPEHLGNPKLIKSVHWLDHKGSKRGGTDGWVSANLVEA